LWVIFGLNQRFLRYKADALPRLTPERIAQLKALATLPDSEIDYSDIPQLDESFWLRAERKKRNRAETPMDRAFPEDAK
jgi:hypothetical protein